MKIKGIFSFGLSPFLLILAFWASFCPEASASTSQIRKIAVLDFENDSIYEELDYLKIALPEMITSDLLNIEGITVLEREQVSGLIGEKDLITAGLIDEKLVAEFRKVLDADYLLLGKFTERAGTFSIDMTIRDITTKKDIRLKKIEGKREDILDLEQNLVSLIIEFFKIDTGKKEFIVPQGESRHKRTLAVMRFENQSPSDRLDPLELGFADLLTKDLSKLEAMHLVEREDITKVVDELNLTVSGLTNPKTAAKVGKMLGAEILILGRFVEIGPKLRLSVKLVETDTSKVMTICTVIGRSEEFYQIESDVAREVINFLDIAPSEAEKKSLGQLMSKSLEASLFYYMGEEFKMKFNYAKAIESYQTALLLDPNLAYAYRELADICMNHDDWTKAREYCRRFLDKTLYDPNNREAGWAQYIIARSYREEWKQKGKSSDSSADLEKSIDEFKDAVDKYPWIRADVIKEISLAYPKKQLKDKLVNFYQSIIERFPSTQEAESAEEALTQLLIALSPTEKIFRDEINKYWNRIESGRYPETLQKDIQHIWRIYTVDLKKMEEGAADFERFINSSNPILRKLATDWAISLYSTKDKWNKVKEVCQKTGQTIPLRCFKGLEEWKELCVELEREIQNSGANLELSLELHYELAQTYEDKLQDKDRAAQNYLEIVNTYFPESVKPAKEKWEKLTGRKLTYSPQSYRGKDLALVHHRHSKADAYVLTEIYQSLEENGFHTHLNSLTELTAEILSGYKLLILDQGDRQFTWGATPFTKQEIEAIHEFVRKGGKLFILLDSSVGGRESACDVYNPLVKEFGVRIEWDKSVYGKEGARVIKHPITEGLKKILCTRAIALLVDKAQPIAWMQDYPVVVTSRYGRGRMVIVGTFSPPLPTPLRTLNRRRLILNTISWLSERPVRFKSDKLYELLEVAEGTYDSGKYEEASKLYEKIIEQSFGPEFLPDFYLKLAQCYQSCSLWEKALKVYQKYILVSDSGMAHYCSGMILAQYLNRPEEAIKELTTALEMLPVNSSYYGSYTKELKPTGWPDNTIGKNEKYLLGECYEKIGNDAMALNFYRKVSEKASVYNEAQRRIKNLEEKDKKLLQASESVPNEKMGLEGQK